MDNLFLQNFNFPFNHPAYYSNEDSDDDESDQNESESEEDKSSKFFFCKIKLSCAKLLIDFVVVQCLEKDEKNKRKHGRANVLILNATPGPSPPTS